MQTLAKPENTSEPRDTAAIDDSAAELGGYTLELMWGLRQDAAKAFEPLGFRTVRALLLEFIGRGYTQPKELAERLGVVAPAVSTMIAELTERGLLERQNDPNDRRRVQLSLTAAGAEARAQLLEAWNEAGRGRLNRLSGEELRTFVRLCHKLIAD